VVRPVLLVQQAPQEPQELLAPVFQELYAQSVLRAPQVQGA
jgi:hypothetical protein